MMFGSKSKGVFIDVADEFAMIARTSGIAAPFVIEEIKEIRIQNPAAAAEEIRSIAGGKGNGFTQAVCGVYPANRIVSRLSVEPRKFREPGYLEKHVEENLKIEPSAYSLFALSTLDGSDCSLQKTPPKDLLVCGAPTGELAAQQERLLELGLFPRRMEIGSVATVGGVINALACAETRVPLLLLEIGAETTNVFIVSRDGIDVTRGVAFGVQSIIPAVQRELALKDEEAARRLLFSNTFDFTGMAPQLLKRLIRELQASIGFYEVQTGQSVGHLCCTTLPSQTAWLEAALADVLGMKKYSVNHREWLQSMSIDLLPSVNLPESANMWTGLFSLMGTFVPRCDEAAA